MINCPICYSETQFFVLKKDSFSEKHYYFRCKNCKFLFKRGLVVNNQKLKDKISLLYQKDYFQKIDCGWKERGGKVAARINKFLKIYTLLKFKKKLTVLDYGGGNGYITSKINKNFNVFYYDKYTKPIYASANYRVLKKPNQVNVVYAIEVVEHITDLEEWKLLSQLASEVFFFTTELSDGIEDRELKEWWYLNPDAGHTAIYSLKSLHLLAKKYGFCYFFFPSKSFHIFLRNSLLSRFNIAKLEYPFYNFFRKIKHTLK